MTTMNPATRRLIKVMPEDMERTMQVFDLLLGDNLQGRKTTSPKTATNTSTSWMCRLFSIFFLLLQRKSDKERAQGISISPDPHKATNNRFGFLGSSARFGAVQNF